MDGQKNSIESLNNVVNAQKSEIEHLKTSLSDALNAVEVCEAQALRSKTEREKIVEENNSLRKQAHRNSRCNPAEMLVGELQRRCDTLTGTIDRLEKEIKEYKALVASNIFTPQNSVNVRAMESVAEVRAANHDLKRQITDLEKELSGIKKERDTFKQFRDDTFHLMTEIEGVPK